MEVSINKLLRYLGFFIGVIIFWQALILIHNHYLPTGETSIEAFVPTPFTIIKTFLDKQDLLVSELVYTLIRAFLGLLIGFIMAVVANAVFFVRPSLKNFVLPLSMAINAFPIIGFSPLIILAFGQGSWLGIVFVSTLISYFPILISLEKALDLNAKEYYELGKIWKVPKLKIFLRIQLPLAMPYAVGSLKMAIPASIIGATLGEWLGTNHGIGRLVVVALYQLNPGLLYSSLLLILFSSLILTWISTLIEKKYFRWL